MTDNMMAAAAVHDGDGLYGMSGAARLAGVIGWPIAHSLSPRLHGYWLRRHCIDGAYVPLAVRPEHLGEALSALAKIGFRGVNVTFPHKERALSLVDIATPAARNIGAVNTIVIDDDGQLLGSNTDAFGFIHHLRCQVPEWCSADRGPAVILGAGGAARAIVYALVEEERVTEVRLINRDLGRAMKLAACLAGPIRPLSWTDLSGALVGAKLLVNTTPLGMTGQPDLDINLEQLPRDAVVYDIVYTPLETALMAAARARGHRVVGGLGMLMHQARPGFFAWFGLMPEVTPDLYRMLAGYLAAR